MVFFKFIFVSCNFVPLNLSLSIFLINGGFIITWVLIVFHLVGLLILVVPSTWLLCNLSWRFTFLFGIDFLQQNCTSNFLILLANFSAHFLCGKIVWKPKSTIIIFSDHACSDRSFKLRSFACLFVSLLNRLLNLLLFIYIDLSKSSFKAYPRCYLHQTPHLQWCSQWAFVSFLNQFALFN